MTKSRLDKVDRRRREIDKRTDASLTSIARLTRSDPRLLNGLTDFMKRSPTEEEVTSEASGSGSG
ncbi:MAG: hypothetical protein WDZ93_03315 [Candidatus Paceibacterota bacterium]